MENNLPTTTTNSIQVSNKGLVLQDIDQLYRFAQMAVQSGFCPKGMEKPQSVMMAVQWGAEVGLPPMAAIQNIAVINGRPSLWGDAALAICQASPMFEDIEEEFENEDDLNRVVAVCRVFKKGKDKPLVRKFGAADAKAANLLGKPGPWQSYPKRMMQMRARSWALRDAFPGALKGLLLEGEGHEVEQARQRVVVESSDASPAYVESVPTVDEDGVIHEAESESEEDAAPSLADDPEIKEALQQLPAMHRGAMLSAAAEKGWDKDYLLKAIAAGVKKLEAEAKPKPKPKPVEVVQEAEPEQEPVPANVPVDDDDFYTGDDDGKLF